MSGLFRSEFLRYWSRPLPRYAIAVAVGVALLVTAILLLRRETVWFWPALESVGYWFKLVGVFVAVAVGASIVIVDISSGSLATALTFYPSRIRFLFVRLSVVAASTGIAAVAVLAAAWACVGVLAATSGGLEPDSPVQVHRQLGVPGMAEDLARTFAGTGLAAAVGAALGFVVRSSAAIVTALFLLYVVGERALGGLFGMGFFWGPSRCLVHLATGNSVFVLLEEPQGHYAPLLIFWTASIVLLAALAVRRFEFPGKD